MSFRGVLAVLKPTNLESILELVNSASGSTRSSSFRILKQNLSQVYKKRRNTTIAPPVRMDRFFRIHQTFLLFFFFYNLFHLLSLLLFSIIFLALVYFLNLFNTKHSVRFLIRKQHTFFLLRCKKKKKIRLIFFLLRTKETLIFLNCLLFASLLYRPVLLNVLSVYLPPLILLQTKKNIIYRKPSGVYEIFFLSFHFVYVFQVQ